MDGLISVPWFLPAGYRSGTQSHTTVSFHHQAENQEAQETSGRDRSDVPGRPIWWKRQGEGFRLADHLLSKLAGNRKIVAQERLACRYMCGVKTCERLRSSASLLRTEFDYLHSFQTSEFQAVRPYSSILAMRVLQSVGIVSAILGAFLPSTIGQALPACAVSPHGT